MIFASKFSLCTCLFVSIWTVAALADCVEDRRRLDTGGTETAQLRGYLCDTGSGSGSRVRIEFFRLSDFAASTLLAAKASDTLRRIIGSPLLIKTMTGDAYADLLSRFGALMDPDLIPQYTIDAAAQGGTITGRPDDLSQPIKVLSNARFEAALPYPAVEEHAAARDKIIPARLNYFYSAGCSESDPVRGARTTCQSGRDSMQLWRSMRATDVTEYSRRMAAFNRLFVSRQFSSSTAVPRELRLASYIAEGNWPPDFMYLVGLAKGGDCEGMIFWAHLRAFALDVAVIENVSSKPVTINDVFGYRSPGSHLRPTTSTLGDGTDEISLGLEVGTLGPGQKAVIPIRIFLGNFDDAKKPFNNRQRSAQTRKQIGPNDFSGRTSNYGVPTFTNFTYGPEVVIRGLTIDGIRVALKDRSANYLEMTWVPEGGSCPFLLTGSPNGEWIDRGKVLDRAPSKNQQYTEMRSFRGFQPRFRIEEREPEIAFIDKVELVVSLLDGTHIVLATDNLRLRARDGSYVSLVWGESIDFNFSLPRGVNEDQVLESRLLITGYYLRYLTAPERANTSAAPSIRAPLDQTKKIRASFIASPSQQSDMACIAPLRPAAWYAGPYEPSE